MRISKSVPGMPKQPAISTFGRESAIEKSKKPPTISTSRRIRKPDRALRSSLKISFTGDAIILISTIAPQISASAVMRIVTVSIDNPFREILTVLNQTSAQIISTDSFAGARQRQAHHSNMEQQKRQNVKRNGQMSV